MGRRLTGTVEWRSGMWRAKLTMPDGSRPWVEMPGIARDDEPAARAVARAMAERAKTGGHVPSWRSETVNEYLVRWVKWRSASGIASAGENKSAIATHFAPKYGPVPMQSIEKGHLEDFVVQLDKGVRAGDLRWKTALNVWSSVAMMFRDAASAKDRSMRLLDTNPALAVRSPDKGEETAKQYLYPDEFLALVGCDDVPLARARLYALAVYTYSRAGEIVPLTWADVDIVHGRVHFHQSVDRVRTPSRVKATKTKKARRIAIEPRLMPMLCAMKEDGGTRVVPELPRANGDSGLANVLRKDLRVAGVLRDELFTPTRTRKPITFHDLRATGTTWMAVRGVDPLKIQQRAGHSSFQTTQGYIREAEVQRDGFGEVFPELPDRLLGNRPGIVQSSKKKAKTSMDQWAQQDLKRCREASEVLEQTLNVREPGASNRPAADDSLTATLRNLSEALVLAVRSGDAVLAGQLSRHLESFVAVMPPGTLSAASTTAEVAS